MACSGWSATTTEHNIPASVDFQKSVYMKIEVFKTNVDDQNEAAALAASLSNFFPHSRITFDLEDCDKVLRIEGNYFDADAVSQMLMENGYECSILD